MSGTLSSEALARLPFWLRELLDNCPAAGDGVHFWIFRVARHLLAHFDEESAYEIIRAKAASCGRPIGKLEREIIAQIKGALPRRWQPKDPQAFATGAQVSVEHLLAFTNTCGFVTCARNLEIIVSTRILQRSGSGKPRPTLVWCLRAR